MGFVSSGSFKAVLHSRAAELLGPSMLPVMDPLTLKVCNHQYTCKDVLVGLECVPQKAKQCPATSEGNVGNDNEGVHNFGKRVCFKLTGLLDIQ